jgi:hypothetical protein
LSRAIRFSEPEKKAVERAIEVLANRGKENKDDAKAALRLAQLLVKMEAANQPKAQVAKGLGYYKFAEICRSVLSDRLVVPVNVTNQYMIIVSTVIRTAGLTEDTALQAALSAKRTWKGRIKLESIARQANVLLTDYKEESNEGDNPGVGRGGNSKWSLEEFDPDAL